jgi:hypothetical protein
MNIKHALIKAFQDAGEKIPARSTKRKKKKELDKSRAHKRQVDVKPEWKATRKQGAETGRSHIKKDLSNESLETKKPKIDDKKRPMFEVEFSDQVSPLFTSEGALRAIRLLKLENDGRSWVVDPGTDFDDEQDIFLGLDFGTSSVKAIIGDRNRKAHYAVPFRYGQYIDQYLLPTCLYQEGDTFSLESESGVVFRNLKLDLMDYPDSKEAQLRCVAFLALAIQRIRGWFLGTHAETYRYSDLLWTLNIGIPSVDRGTYSVLMEQIGWAAWIVASEKGGMTQELVSKGFETAGELVNGLAEPSEQEDLEVAAVPEIAAQIYGYVKSDAFDPNAQNLFLLADVGAGTVDCALFKVRQQTNGEEDFLFYQKSVEPYGVANLHRRRLEWWEEVFLSMEDKPENLLGLVQGQLEQIDAAQHIPDRCSDYFSGVRVKGNPELGPYVANPDGKFKKQITEQVQVKTLHKAKSSGDWHVEALRNTPFFLCGGGTRNEFYQRINESVQHHPSVSFLRLSPKTLARPSNIIAPGLARKDWDRLSVAYGLSFRKVGKATDVEPVAESEVRVNKSWRENYPEK